MSNGMEIEIRELLVGYTNNPVRKKGNLNERKIK